MHLAVRHFDANIDIVCGEIPCTRHGQYSREQYNTRQSLTAFCDQCFGMAIFFFVISCASRHAHFMIAPLWFCVIRNSTKEQSRTAYAARMARILAAPVRIVYTFMLIFVCNLKASTQMKKERAFASTLVNCDSHNSRSCSKQAML